MLLGASRRQQESLGGTAVICMDGRCSARPHAPPAQTGRLTKPTHAAGPWARLLRVAERRAAAARARPAGNGREAGPGQWRVRGRRDAAPRELHEVQARHKLRLRQAALVAGDRRPHVLEHALAQARLQEESETLAALRSARAGRQPPRSAPKRPAGRLGLGLLPRRWHMPQARVRGGRGRPPPHAQTTCPGREALTEPAQACGQRQGCMHRERLPPTRTQGSRRPGVACSASACGQRKTRRQRRAGAAAAPPAHAWMYPSRSASICMNMAR